MKKFLSIFLLLGLIISNNVYAKEKSEIDKAVKILIKTEAHEVSIFSIFDSGVGSCSGAVIKNSIDGATILTAKHCVGVTQEMYVENVKVTSVQTSLTEDLALLKTEEFIDGKIPAWIASRNARIGSTLYGVGYPGLEKFPLLGVVYLPATSNHYAKMEVIGGCSGAGVFNEDLELVGIVWGSVPAFNLGIYEPLTKIKEFLKQVNFEG